MSGKEETMHEPHVVQEEKEPKEERGHQKKATDRWEKGVREDNGTKDKGNGKRGLKELIP